MLHNFGACVFNSFMGELFKLNIFTPIIMMYGIENRVTKHLEEPLMCLCNSLKSLGKVYQVIQVRT